MPTITPSPVITDSAQVNAGVITSSDIANDSIVDADINSAAAIAGSKLQALSVGVNAGVIPSTGIVNDHIAAAAGIVDTKLATISTAGKVDGAAITGLASVPAGAGVIPAANIPSTAPIIERSCTEVEVTNRNDEVTVMSCAIAGGTLGTTGGIRGHLFFKTWQTGASTNVTVKVKYGATTIATATFVATATTPAMAEIEIILLANGATNAQMSYVTIAGRSDNLTAVTTIAAHNFFRATATAAEDSTAEKNLVVTIQPASAQANQQHIMDMYYVEKI